eukprot:11184589-Lingulodinium_polyedra.AAC.1
MGRPAARTIVAERHAEIRQTLEARFGYNDGGRIHARRAPDGTFHALARDVCGLIKNERWITRH